MNYIYFSNIKQEATCPYTTLAKHICHSPSSQWCGCKDPSSQSDQWHPNPSAAAHMPWYTLWAQPAHPCGIHWGRPLWSSYAPANSSKHKETIGNLCFQRSALWSAHALHSRNWQQQRACTAAWTETFGILGFQGLRIRFSCTKGQPSQ